MKYTALIIAGIIASGCSNLPERMKELYQQGMNDPNYMQLKEHFPNNPTEVSWVQYWPIEWQGGSVFQVMQTSDNVDRVWNEYSSEFIYTTECPCDRWIEDPKNLNNSRPLTRLFITRSGDALGDGWKIGVLIAMPYKSKGEQIWNHGQSAGIAVNAHEQKVLYWAEIW